MVTQEPQVATGTVDVRLERLTKRFDDVAAVDELDLDVEHGRFLALLGPSGCGKTTTLRMIGGFEEPTSGRIYLDGKDVVNLPPYKRDVNTVFQSYALFPHLSIFENVAFGLRRKKLRGNELRTRVIEALELVGLAGVENRKPRQLSGGQQQRIALARSLVNRPRVLLLDEPLGALDLKLRKEMQLELKRIQHDVGITFIHVTHDQEEAMTMADRIVIMNAGRIEQAGTPDELYEQPETAFVAGFLGVSNLLDGVLAGPDRVRLGDGTEVSVPASVLAERSGPIAIGIRPGEDPPRRRASQPLGRHDHGDGVHRRLDPVPRRHGGGHRRAVRPERPPGRHRAAGGGTGHAELGPGLHLRHRQNGDLGMSERIDRRELLRRGVAGSALLTVPGLLAACGGGGGIKGAAGTTATTTVNQTLAKSVNFSNWPLYIDYDPKTKGHPSLAQFTKATGVKVNYTEDINDNRTFFGKIEGPLAHGQSIHRDLIVMTDSSGFPQRMIGLGWLEKLDKSAIPNIKNLVAAQQHPQWDPNREYSLPWQSGMTGIGYDPTKVGGDVTSIKKLLTDPKLKGKITLLTEQSDTMGLAMLANGDDPSHVTDPAWNRAMTLLQKAVSSGQVRQFTGNDYAPLLAKGDIWACFAWSGDMVQLRIDHPNLKWVVPDEGAMIWTDNMLIPKGGDVVHRLDADELVLQAVDRGGGGGLRQLHLAGRRRRRAPPEDRPGDREEPAHLPDRRDAREGAPDRSEVGEQPEVQAAVPAPDRGLTRVGAIRGRSLAPYLLLAPGIAWLILFFVVPMYYLAITSLQTGSLEVGYTFNWAWNNYREAITTYQHAVLPLDQVRRDRHRALAARRAIRSRTGSRSAAGAGRTCSCCS